MNNFVFCVLFTRKLQKTSSPKGAIRIDNPV